MKELSREDFEQILPLVRASGMKGHLTFIYSVLEGRQPGRVFVDDLHEINTAIFCNLTGFYFGFGVPEKEQVWPVVAEWFIQPMTEEITVLFGLSQAWDELLSGLMPAQGTARLSFDYDPARQQLKDWRPLVPEGFSIQPINEALAASIVDGTGTGGYGIDPWFVRIAGGPAAYAAHGLGLALIDGSNGQIASLCGFCSLGHGEAEMEVGTPPEYRARGFASLVSAAFIEQCHEMGWKPAYTCTSDNFASISVAHKLGFFEVEELSGYPIPMVKPTL
jgi:RimJ/RimL family protein N-acetyltransferase